MNKLSTDPGSNIFLIGFMGSGKTHWGKIWAAAHRRTFIDLDEVIEKKYDKTIAAIFETDGEDYFRKIEAETLRACALMQNAIIACGGGTPCFYDSMQWMNDNGITLYITSMPAEIVNRVSSELEKRPLFKNMSGAEILLFIEQKLTERLPFYTQAKFIVPANQLTEASLNDIISHQR